MQLYPLLPQVYEAGTHVDSQQSPPSYEHEATLFEESHMPSPAQLGLTQPESRRGPIVPKTWSPTAGTALCQHKKSTSSISC